MAVPDRRMQTREPMGEGRPTAPARPARFQAVPCALPRARCRRARVRTPEARMGAAATARPQNRTRATACQSVDSHSPRRAARQGTDGAGNSRLRLCGVRSVLSGPFDSAWLKWSRAIVHTKAHEAEVDRLARDPNVNP